MMMDRGRIGLVALAVVAGRLCTGDENNEG